MITFQQAKQIALDRIGPDCALIEKATVEKPYGWYFCYQSKAYLESRKIEDMLYPMPEIKLHPLQAKA